MRLAGKRVLVTGGGSGIGRALAIAMAAEGAHVAVCGRHQEVLDEVHRRYHEIRRYRADVTDAADIARLKEQLDRDMDGIDVLVNNAGRMVIFDFCEGVPHAVEGEIALNLLAPIRLIRLFLPQLLSRTESAVVNVSSGYALWPNRTAPVYSATKAALHSLSKSLRWQLEGGPVKVFEILPPLVLTASATSSHGAMAPDRFAEAAVHHILRDTREIEVGQVRLLDWGRRVSPGLVDHVLKNR